MPQAAGPWSDIALYSIGWKAFQDLCSQVCNEVLKQPVQIYREAQDGGQDAVFISASPLGPKDATIQCKHSSDPNRRLKVGDLTKELQTVRSLVQLGQADTYILMTSMSVDAPVALKLRAKLKSVGVTKARIFGKEFLVRAIKYNSKLRALVPQVYGLGDLSTILDQRLVEQTRALIDSWIPKLKIYVPTRSHRAAVQSLIENKIVLLTGNPSAGKSTIGAILSTIATEGRDHNVYYLTSPRDFEKSWNPNDRKRFFWIDDAFGPNILRDEYVQDWTSIFSKVSAAILQGNRFVLTSRRHIYEAAKVKLGQRNLQVFITGAAVVDVGKLSDLEKKQILYNHINFGNQSQSWKRSVKPYLNAVAGVDGFLPGIAERLGNPKFTRSLVITEKELIRFMEEPKEHLIDTINALDDTLRAGLMAIYVHQGRFSVDLLSSDASQAVSTVLSVSLPRICERLKELEGSFVSSSVREGKQVWTFSHPTISDALTDILKGHAYMMEVLLRGATIETILSGFVCEGVQSIVDAPIIPASLNYVLASRLRDTRDKPNDNRELFYFLAHRASMDIIEKLLRLDPEILKRKSWNFYRSQIDPKTIVYGKAFRVGLLPPDLRNEAASKLETIALDDFDISFADDESILGLIPPQRLLSLGLELRSRTLVGLADRITEIEESAELSEDPDSHFELVTKSIEILENFIQVDAETETLLSEAKDLIESSIDTITMRKEQQEEDEGDHSEDWEHMMGTNKAAISAQEIKAKNSDGPEKSRSIFDDIDD